MKKIFTLLALSASLCVSAKHPFVSTGLVISEVYGGGGNAGATFRNDFVELYNAGSTAVSLNGLSIQYGSAGGFPTMASGIVALSNVSLNPGEYYLISLASGGAIGTALPTPDQSATSPNLSATSGKVFLVTGTSFVTACTNPSIIDMVGFGSPSCSETAAAPAGSNTLSVARNVANPDTDDNSVDFTAQAPTPQGRPAVVAIAVNQLSASKAGTKSNLSWSLGCSATQCTYELQRSANGINFAVIQTETVLQDRCSYPFSYNDATPLKSVNYYRIKLIDIDGKVTYSNIAAVRFNGNESIKVVPTIAVNDVKVFYESAVSGNSTWIVYDMAGRVVSKSNANLLKGQNTITISVSNLMKGQYQIVGNTESGKTDAVKIIKQ